MIIPADSTNIRGAAFVHAISWQASHRSFCRPDFVALHTPERQQAYLQRKIDSGSRCYILYHPTPIGLVSVTGSLIEDLYILPGHQRKGLGTALLAFAIGQCGGTPTLWILENNHAAEAFYRRMGFRETGRRKNIANGLDEIEMALTAELWDAYDDHLRALPNVSLVRGQMIPEGMYHLVGEIMVRHRDGTWLLMQRDPRRPYGGLWELTAGGSALKGETPLACATRELKEETGIDAPALQEMQRIVDKGQRTIYVDYLCVTDCDKDAVTLQAGETVAYRWVSRDELFAMGGDALMSKRAMNIVKEMGL